MLNARRASLMLWAGVWMRRTRVCTVDTVGVFVVISYSDFD